MVTAIVPRGNKKWGKSYSENEIINKKAHEKKVEGVAAH
jgi:hypothetical protein